MELQMPSPAFLLDAVEACSRNGRMVAAPDKPVVTPCLSPMLVLDFTPKNSILAAAHMCLVCCEILPSNM